MGTRAKIATIAYRAETLPQMTQEALIDHTLSLVDGLSGCRADLICLPEEILIIKGDRNNPRFAENNARMLAALCDRARAQRALIACCLEEPSEKYPGKRYNTAYLIGRDGRLIGRYRKRYLTFRALEQDGIPGCALPVFDTDIGRIGLMTCFDIGWRQPWAELAEKGCELVLWNAAYDGGNLLNTYAAHNMYFVASSVWSDHAKIIDPTGRTIEVSSRWDGVAMATVNLGMEIFHSDRQTDRPAKLRAALGDRITIRSHSQENIFTVESNDDEWPMERVKREFDLMSYKDYHSEYGRLNNLARERFPE